MREKERVTNMLAGAQQQLYATEREKQSITQQLLHNQHLLRQMVRYSNNHFLCPLSLIHQIAAYYGGEHTHTILYFRLSSLIDALVK